MKKQLIILISMFMCFGLELNAQKPTAFASKTANAGKN